MPTACPSVPMISVVICTHNPRRDYLQASLDGLRKQTLPATDWEFLLVDNGSTPALGGEIDLSGLPAARIVREEELGLTPARQRGLAEARAEIVLYVDDDNVLDPDYLAHVARMGREWPMLGAWGSGELRGVFETPPPAWMEPHLWYVTVHRVEKDIWSNQPDMNCFPPGAGLAVRKAAAQPYFAAVKQDAFRRSLDRRGNNLSSSGDMDLLWTMTENGWGVGRFTGLKLQHLIAGRRLEEGYFQRLIANQWCSNVLLKYLHGVREVEGKESLLRRISRQRYERSLDERSRWLAQAERKGRLHAAEIIAEVEKGNRGVRQSI